MELKEIEEFTKQKLVEYIERMVCYLEYNKQDLYKMMYNFLMIDNIKIDIGIIFTQISENKEGQNKNDQVEGLFFK